MWAPVPAGRRADPCPAQNYPKARERLEDLRRGGARMQKAQVSRSDVKNNHKEGECAVM